MLRKILVLVLVAVGGTSMFSSGCQEPTKEEKHQRAVRKMVREVLKHLEFRRGSRIQFCTTLLKEGRRIEFGLPADDHYEIVVLEASGYLIFVDEMPTYDWEHPAQWVFFEPHKLNEPKVLFRNEGAMKIVDKDGKRIPAKWVYW